MIRPSCTNLFAGEGLLQAPTVLELISFSRTLETREVGEDIQENQQKRKGKLKKPP